ncbi:MAG: N-acetyl-gamma-glutamyl-phosphate reductase [Alphaproteobacteria bacterium]|nr:N-acetyl-gamma-glutamyl-phosphate reductase [Alphaproteobacteria bacterium]
MAPTVFIDGEAGTTGLQIRDRLSGRSDVALLQLDDAVRKDTGARKDALNACDLAVLCLPDAAAREAVALIDNNKVKVIDASTAHRTADGWVYGFPELDSDQSARIAEAGRVSNPGCYPTGAVALLHPLIASVLVPADFPISINAVSGYSGGGRQNIESYEDSNAPNPVTTPMRTYGLALQHKHVPEMRKYAGLQHDPIFFPQEGRYSQGMLVQVPINLWSLPKSVKPSDLHACLSTWYADQPFVTVAPADEAAAMTHLGPEGLNGTNQMTLHVFGNEEREQAVLVALLDNLGKGASGQAVQCLNLMLGLDETAGL